MKPVLVILFLLLLIGLGIAMGFSSEPLRFEETLAGKFLRQVSFFLKRGTGRTDKIVHIWQPYCNHEATSLKTKSTWENGRAQSWEVPASLMGHWAIEWSSPGAACLMWDNKCSLFEAVESSFLLLAVKSQLWYFPKKSPHKSPDGSVLIENAWF